MDLELLRDIGLTKNEIKVYLALLKIGINSATHIAKEAHIHRSKVYDSLQGLIDKGLVHYTTKNFKKIFSANSPQELITIIEEKEIQIQNQKKRAKKLTKDLENYGTSPRQDSTSNTYEGLKGIKVFHNKVLASLKQEDYIKVLGIPKIANELLEGYFQEFHIKRIHKKIPIKLLYTYEARKLVKDRKQLKLTAAKYLDKTIETPSVIWIAKETIGIFTFEPQTICYEIQNKEIAQSFKIYFDYLWKLSKK